MLRQNINPKLVRTLINWVNVVLKIKHRKRKENVNKQNGSSIKYLQALTNLQYAVTK